MKLFSLFFMTIFMLSFASISADDNHCNHNCRRTNNDFIPTLRLQLTPEICSDWFAFSFLGEAGVRNYRANGTLGFALAPCQRLKVGGEYLTQKLGYNFSSGKASRWMHQYAVGGTYQYLVDCNFIQSLDVHGHYSHAYSRQLSRATCFPDIFTERRVRRHIAGSDAYNVSGGVTLNPWCFTNISLSLDYDNVRYNRKFHKHHTVSGFGGTVGFIQNLPYNFNVGFRGEFKRPYNYLEALIGWNTCTSWGNVNIGVYGGHTYGKEHLPSSTVAGIALNWDFDWGFGGYFNNTCCPQDICCYPCYSSCNDLAKWIEATPAVYVPEVLAISEQRRRTSCFPPVVLGTLTVPIAATPAVIATALLFNTQGEPVTFSITTDAEVTATIDPVTGVITVTAIADLEAHIITVTATTARGCSSSTTVTVQLTEAVPFRFP